MGKLTSLVSLGCALSGILLLAHCSKDKAPIPVDAVADTSSTTVIPPDCDSSKVLYCNKIKTILNTNCTLSGCHVTGASIGDFTNYSGVLSKVNSGALKVRILENFSMPPSGPLSNSDTTLISTWLKEGAKEK